MEADEPFDPSTLDLSIVEHTELHHYQRSCLGKHRFGSYHSAKHQADRLEVRYGTEFSMYHCQWCQGYHNGNKKPVLLKERNRLSDNFLHRSPSKDRNNATAEIRQRRERDLTIKKEKYKKKMTEKEERLAKIICESTVWMEVNNVPILGSEAIEKMVAQGKIIEALLVGEQGLSHPVRSFLGNLSQTLQTVAIIESFRRDALKQVSPVLDAVVNIDEESLKGM